MLCPETVNRVIDAVKEICDHSIEIDIVTNGTAFSKIKELIDIEKLDSIHLSRHCIKDEDNNRLFGFPTEYASDIAAVLNALEDPAMVVLNCVLQKKCIDNEEMVTDYLEFADELGVRNVSFIGMSKLNEYCKLYYVDPAHINWSQNRGFHIWNAYQDHDYCSCSSGSYDGKYGSIRFYFRRIGKGRAPYARQLVYTADNRLLAGFSGNEIRFDEKR